MDIEIKKEDLPVINNWLKIFVHFLVFLTKIL
jgi:hypothetical protein